AVGREAPFVLRVGRHVRGVPQVVRIAIDAVGRACLEQQDRAGWIFAQPAGQGAARWASSHDDYIDVTGVTVADVGHGSRSPRVDNSRPDPGERAGDASSPD